MRALESGMIMLMVQMAVRTLLNQGITDLAPELIVGGRASERSDLYGLGAVLYERATYDDDANLQSATYMDYLIPTSMEIPEIEVHDLLAMDLADLAVERAMLLALARARTVHEVYIVNGPLSSLCNPEVDAAPTVDPST